MSLTKDDLKKLVKYEPVSIMVEGLGEIKIIPMSQRVRVEAREVAMDGQLMRLDKFQAYVILSCMVEPQLDIGDLEWVENLPAGIADKILSEIYKISGITIDTDELKKK